MQNNTETTDEEKAFLAANEELASDDSDTPQQKISDELKETISNLEKTYDEVDIEETEDY